MAVGAFFNVATRASAMAQYGGRGARIAGKKAGWQKVGKLTGDGKVKISSTGRVVSKSYANSLGKNPALLKKHRDAAKKSDLSSTSKGRRAINKARKDKKTYTKAERKKMTATLKKTQKEARKAGPKKRKQFNKAVTKNPKKFDAKVAPNNKANKSVAKKQRDAQIAASKRPANAKITVPKAARDAAKSGNKIKTVQAIRNSNPGLGLKGAADKADALIRAAKAKK